MQLYVNNHGFAMLIFMPRFKSITFYQNRPKIKLFLQKKQQNFKTPETAPPTADFWLSAWGECGRNKKIETILEATYRTA